MAKEKRFESKHKVLRQLEHKLKDDYEMFIVKEILPEVNKQIKNNVK